MELYESTYFIVLVPPVVITVIFGIFWLFMKETSYDEVWAKQKKDQKLQPAKPDKKRVDKKKNKRREAQNGKLPESDSESARVDFDLTDALLPDEEHTLPASQTALETPSGLRERRRKEKKPSKPAQEETGPKEADGGKFTSRKVDPIPLTKPATSPGEAAASKKKTGQKKPRNAPGDSPTAQESKVESSVSAAKKHDPLVSPLEARTQETAAGKKKQAVKKQKLEDGPALVDEPLIHATTYIPLMDNTELTPTVEKKDVAELGRSEVSEVVQQSSVKKVKSEAPKENGSRAGSKKKPETTDGKFRDLLLDMKNMVFTEEEAFCVVDLLKGKSGAVQETLQKASKGESALHQLQEKEKFIAIIKEEAATAKEQVKQLTQELMAEKEKSGLAEHKIRERFSVLEKEHGALQNKVQGSYQEAQQMQVKFQQVREQLEDQIARLKQENGILRDAVSSATNQMESKQSSELTKLRQDCARLMNDLTEKNTKLAQEELQKKSTEQTVAQLKAQQKDAELRWDELQSYLRKRTAEYEAAQQDAQNALLAKESEVQSLHSKLTDTMVSKEQLEQRLLRLEAEESRAMKDCIRLQVQELMDQNDSLQTQIQKYHAQMAAQTSASALVEELQKAIADKDEQIKQREDSLAFEQVHLTKREEELEALQRKNAALRSELQHLQGLKSEQALATQALEQMHRNISDKDDTIRALEEKLQHELIHFSKKMEDFQVLQKQCGYLQVQVEDLQAQLSEQADQDVVEQMQKTIQEKDDKLKTVEELLEAGFIQVANKEEELKAMRQQHLAMQRDFDNLQAQRKAQASSQALIEELKEVINEQDGKIKSKEELLQAAILKAANQEEAVQALKQEIEALKERNTQLQHTEQVSAASQVEELQSQLRGWEEKVRTLEARVEETEKAASCTEKDLQELQTENEHLKLHISEIQEQQVSSTSHALDLQNRLSAREERIAALMAELDKSELDCVSKDHQLLDLQKEGSVLKSELQALKQQYELYQQEQQGSYAAHSEDLLNAMADKEQEISSLRSEVESLKNVIDQQRMKSDERQRHVQIIGTEGSDMLPRRFAQVPGPPHVDMEQRLKEAEDVRVLMQLECEKYKSVLAETEGILQRLQRSVEEEEGRWKVKLEDTQKELLEVRSLLNTLQQEAATLRTENKNIEHLKKAREHLESELEKAESERMTYVDQVRELRDLLKELQHKLDDSGSEAVRQNEQLCVMKMQLSDTLLKLEAEKTDRLKAAGNLTQAQQSLDLIHSEILKAAGGASEPETRDTSSEAGGKEKMSAGVSQTVVELQQQFQALHQQLTKGMEHYQVTG